jgi:hypothetical protein
MTVSLLLLMACKHQKLWVRYIVPTCMVHSNITLGQKMLPKFECNTKIPTFPG